MKDKNTEGEKRIRQKKQQVPISKVQSCPGLACSRVNMVEGEWGREVGEHTREEAGII